MQKVRHLTQEELLKEAEYTEKLNVESLALLRAVEEEQVGNLSPSIFLSSFSLFCFLHITIAIIMSPEPTTTRAPANPLLPIYLSIYLSFTPSSTPLKRHIHTILDFNIYSHTTTNHSISRRKKMPLSHTSQQNTPNNSSQHHTHTTYSHIHISLQRNANPLLPVQHTVKGPYIRMLTRDNNKTVTFSEDAALPDFFRNKPDPASCK